MSKNSELDDFLSMERSQAVVRLVVASVVLIILMVMAYLDSRQEHGKFISVYVVSGFWLCSIGWVVMTWLTRKTSKVRRIAALTLDVTATTIAMILAEDFGAFFYPVLQWIVIGHGVRFGRITMLLASALAVAGFGLAITLTLYWKENLLIATGLLIGLFIIPIYLLSLLRKLQELNNMLSQKLDETYHCANYDVVTGLSNRHQFYRRLESMIRQAKRYKRHFAIVYIDLNDFKLVNDEYGHHAGDKVLQVIGERISECTRESDLPARIGGDEFAIIFDGVNSCTDSQINVTRIVDAIDNPIRINGELHNQTASIGISIFPDDGQTSDELLHNADIAMYAAKRSKDRRPVCYSDLQNEQRVVEL